MNKKAFTLVELLVVVLIIGILSAVALPMYQGAVDKSRFATLLPATRSIKNAEESVRAATGSYTENMEDLDISMENGELNFTFDIHNSLADPSLFRVTNPKLDNVRLAAYFDYNPMMAGQMHCEAKAGDERANRLCGKLLMGQELTEKDGFVAYLLDQDVDKATCDNLSLFWSNNFTKCYKTEKERCDANEMPYNNSTDWCGYVNTGGVSLYEGAKCKTTNSYSCSNNTFYAGSECVGDSYGSCMNSTWNTGTTCQAKTTGSCGNGIFEEGTVCIGDAPESCASDYWTKTSGGQDGSIFKSGSKCIASAYGSCEGIFEAGSMCIANAGTNSCGAGYGSHSTKSTFKSGSICVSNAPNTCNGTYDGGCCEGVYCPSKAPKCQD